MAANSEDRPVQRMDPADELVRWRAAAKALGVTDSTLTSWYELGFVPAVQAPGLLFTYQSFIDAVRGGCRPGKAANVEEIGHRWWRAHMPWALEGAA